MIQSAKKLYSFLIQLDKNLYKSFVSITSLRVVEKLAGLAITIFIFRFLTKEEVASYGFIQTIVAICSIFAIQEMQTTVSQSVSRGFYGTYLRFVPFSFTCSLLGVMVLSVFSAYNFLTDHSDLAWGFLIATFLFPFFQGLRLWRGMYLGEGKFTTFSIAEAANAIIKVVLILLFLYLFPHEILYPVLILFLVPSVQNILRTIQTIKRIPKDSRFEEGTLGYSVKANIYSAVNIIADNIDRVLLFSFLSPAALALYMAAEKFSDLVQGMVQDMAAVLAPKFATMGNYSNSLDRKLKILSFLIGCGIVIFAILILPILIPLIFGEHYHDSILYSQILVCAVAVRNIATLRFRFIRSKIDEKSFRQITVYSSIAHILASAILIPFCGLYGAVAAVFIHRLTLSLIVDYIIKKRYLAHGK